MARGRPIVVAAVVAAVMVAGCGGPAQQAPPTGALATLVDQRATRAADEHEPDMNCVARAFGLDPAGAKDIADVRTVYAWVYCQSKQGGGSELVPAAVTLSGQPAVRIPSDDDYAGDIKRIFPPDVRDAAYEMPKGMADLVAGLPTSPSPN